MRRLLLSSCLVVLAACDDPFQVQVQAASVCQHLNNQRFAIPADVRAQVAAMPAALQHVELSRVFDFDVKAKLPAELRDLVDSHVALTSIRVSASQGAPDLSFIDEAHVTLQPQPDSGLEQRQFDYVRTEEHPQTVAWAGQSFDVAAYLESGNLRYLVTFVGSVPPGDVVIDIEACATATVALDYFQP